MDPILKIDRHNEKKEVLFELRYQMSLTSREREVEDLILQDIKRHKTGKKAKR